MHPNTRHWQDRDAIIETIDTPEQCGWPRGVATGKSDLGLNFVLESHSLAERFFTLHTAGRHPSKPHPSMLESCMIDAGTSAMIGDTGFDMAMARAAIYGGRRVCPGLS